jgi:hypothetical protein
MPRNRVQHQKGLSDDASSGSIRMKRRAEKRGSRGAGLRASSVRGVRGQRIVRSVNVNCCNADNAAIRRR